MSVLGGGTGMSAKERPMVILPPPGGTEPLGIHTTTSLVREEKLAYSSREREREEGEGRRKNQPVCHVEGRKKGMEE